MHHATPPVAASAHDHRIAAPRRLWRAIAAVAVIVPLALGACGKDKPAGQTNSNAPVQLSFFWWGGEARAKLTEDALKLYTQKHPNVTFKTTWQANQGYFDKLATLTALSLIHI